MTIEFKAWPKIPRIENEKYSITEKIDGTNACIIIDEEGNFGCQSRSRLITPENDNYGFAKWAYGNKDDLMKLGEGHHFGEWWGQGVQRGYGLLEKRFSLFNAKRWGGDNPNKPECCHVVPIIEGTLEGALSYLKANGSVAAPGYMRVEGLVVYSHLAGVYYKVIIDK